MRKVGGVLLIALGVILLVVAALRAISVLLMFFGGESTAYGIGFIAGTAVVVVLFAALGLKAMKKGKSLFGGESNSERNVS